ncbi:hypothetical protein CHS0354_012049 [Potamilus streckersoni]|uniref:galactosylceramidase n=1 Tax=Potamilus streckersoni TaxID=2493646 RepID=A0AAE0TJS7_9BIVA|nr:hypothetical protein CHS0354_012049 [Potamilus streckersoni]
MLKQSIVIFLFMCVSSNTQTIIIDDTGGLGRQFDGIGGLSGGGATSRLLVNYPEKQRNEILDYLFQPNFGASLHILKVEIGGDAQSTDGTEASHMHNSWEENYERGYEWWLMVEAKKRNPKIKLYGLPWAFPGWVGAGTRSPYTNPEITATYIIKWIQGAIKYYNLTIDYVGIWNERSYDIKYTKVLRQMLDKSGFQNVRIVAADGNWTPVSKDIHKDAELAAAIDIIGVHYPGTKTVVDAVATGKQLWASEDYSTFNDNVGAGCWARILNQNYVNGDMTSTISWNLIASYYSALPFNRDGLMTANSPWSGYYRVESPIWITAHTTQFTSPGWMYLGKNQGVQLLPGGGSIVSLTSQDNMDLTVIIETMSHNHSLCIRPSLPPYEVKQQNVTIQLKGNFANIQKLYVWYSKLSFDQQPSTLFRNLGAIPVVNGELQIDLGIDEMYTMTTLTAGQKGIYPDPPAPTPFPLPYKETFEVYLPAEEPNNFAQQVGSFEVVDTTDSQHKKVYRHVVLHDPITWCPINLVFPISIIGNSSWTDLYVEVDAMIGQVNASDGVFVATRVSNLGCESFHAVGVFFFLFPDKKKYEVTGDLARTQLISSGNADAKTGWNTLGLLVKNHTAVGTLNGKELFGVMLPVKASKMGFAALGTGSFGIADFDNFQIHDGKDGENYLINKLNSYKQKKDDVNLYFKPGRYE